MTASDETNNENRGSSPVARGGAGAYIEGELGAFYLLALMAGIEARGLPGSRIQRVRFQGVELGYALDDLVIHGVCDAGETLLEIQSKRTITFAPRDTIFKEVCTQIANSIGHGLAEERHQLAVATQRTSQSISGPYQDVLSWARTADSGAGFFQRLGARGVAGPKMREFGATFRANLVEAGIADDDDAIWRLVRRFLILEFDFESSAPLARTYALVLARHVLAPEDVPRAESLWSNLIEISLEKARTGAAIERNELREILLQRGFRLAGDRDFSMARAKLAEMSRQALSEIGNMIAGVRLPRRQAIEALDTARDSHRLVEIRGGPGVGKSAVLRQLAERASSDAAVLVLDPIGTPEGGWMALSQLLGVPVTAREFLGDLAASGGGVIFIDSLEMFTSAARRRTVNDILREAAAIPGFSVITTARPDFGADGDNWLASEALSALGASQVVTVGELDDEEVEALREHDPQLRALLAPGHAASAIARNLYRLSRLLKVSSTTAIRTEASLANDWWRSADYAEAPDRRAAQRINADLADAALKGRDLIELRDDTPARVHLLRSQTLVEPRRDHLRFYHDVLRDWAVGARLNEDYAAISALNLAIPVSAKLARGIEFTGRFSLELSQDADRWTDLLARLSSAGAHTSWRRQALLAIIRSELSPVLLERGCPVLLAQKGELLIELCTTVAAMETVSPTELARGLPSEATAWAASMPTSLRIAANSSAFTLLNWCGKHAEVIPFEAISAIVRLVYTVMPLSSAMPALMASVAGMLFGWLEQFDEKSTRGVGSGLFGSMLSELRTTALLLSAHAPDQTKAYINKLGTENDVYKIKEIRPLSATIAPVAPEALAHLVETSLLKGAARQNSYEGRRGDALSYADSDYLPPSPAQPPFFDLLGAAPATGLGLIRRLVDVAVSFHFGDSTSQDDGFSIVFDSGARFFPWEETYYWSRNQASEYSVASGLMALEAWGHERIHSGIAIEAVIEDVLGPPGSCAAYLLVALDLLLSHWPSSRELLVPFMGCPELLATERGRKSHDSLTQAVFGTEPTGKVRLADLKMKPSRRIALEDCLPQYLQRDDASDRLRTLLTAAVAKIGSYAEHADFGDPAFMGAYALNLLNTDNWIDFEEELRYRSPAPEEEHLTRLGRQRNEHLRSSEIQAKVHLTVDDAQRGSTDIAREVAEFADGALPDDSDTDVLASKATFLAGTALLVVRDGDDALLSQYEGWVRQVIAASLRHDDGRVHKPHLSIAYSRTALAVLALIHLWHRRGQMADRDALMAAAARRDCCAVSAFSAASEIVNEVEPRLLKSALRIALQVSRWRRERWDEDKAEMQTYERDKAEQDRRAVDAEIAWLDGRGDEPPWPQFPPEKPTIRHPLHVGAVNTRDYLSPSTAEPVSRIHINSQAAGFWLGLLTGKNLPAWYSEIVAAYADWSASMNGLGHPAEARVEHRLRDWNENFFAWVAHEMMAGGGERFDALLRQIEQLPDHSFADVSEILIHAADVWYFNNAAHSAMRPVELRKRLVARLLNLRHWSYALRPGDISINVDMAGVVAKLLMNTHNPMNRTESYLVPAVFDRVDPLLDTLGPMMSGGPTPFIALCTMRTLSVKVQARHLDFLLFAAEAWLERLPADTRTWIELGVGRMVVEWLTAAISEQPQLYADPMRNRIEALLGKLVSLGVSGAFDLEKDMQQNGVAAP